MKERPILFNGAMVRAILDGRKTQTRRIVTTRHPVTCIGSRDEREDPSSWGYFFDGPDHNGYMVLGRGHDERDDHGRISIPCPFGVAGDRLWVRETWQAGSSLDDIDPATIAERCTEAGYAKPWAPIRYHADQQTANEDTLRDFGGEWGKLRPSIHMPRWASRLTLEVAAIRVQRLQEISEEDARAEGVEPFFARFPEIGRDQRVTSGEYARDAEHRASFAVLWDEINGDRALWSSNPWVWAVTFRRTA